MKLWQKYLSLSKSRQIALFVWAVHFAAILVLSSHHLISSWFSKKPRPIAVRTFQPAPAIKIQPPKAQAPSPSKAAAKPVAKAAPVKKGKAPAAPKRVKTPAPEADHLDELISGLEKLSSEKKVSRSEIRLPKVLTPVVVEGRAGHEPAYAEALVAWLQEALDLPEYGEVRAKLTIDRFGQLVECAILDAKSRQNAEFLKKRLSELSFPCFNDFRLEDLSLSFTVTFKNVEAR